MVTYLGAAAASALNVSTRTSSSREAPGNGLSGRTCSSFLAIEGLIQPLGHPSQIEATCDEVRTGYEGRDRVVVLNRCPFPFPHFAEGPLSLRKETSATDSTLLFTSFG